MPRRCCPASSVRTTRLTRSASPPSIGPASREILAALPAELFRADDALGWVYQFWQAKRKKEVNDSGRKIGGADLPPVTQLFTEHYMVRFLLENSLGAWWAGRHPRSPLLKEWDYLRFRDDGTPAAGTFEGWPERAAEITVMDPCMGSGHFLVAAADMLRKMRIEEEGLTAKAAAAAVVRDNLFGLELDPRCTQLGAFALAFDAWKAGGYQQLPVPNIACSGIAVKGQLDDWKRLAGDDTNMAAALERLYNLFQDAPELGSLIDPAAAAGEGQLWRVDPAALQVKLEIALAKERNDPAAAVFGAAAEGTAKAARLLTGRYWLVATNPPFLGRARQTAFLVSTLDDRFPLARSEMSLAFWLRSFDMEEEAGVSALVSPAGWLHQARETTFRRFLLAKHRWLTVATLGLDAFEGGLRVDAALFLLSAAQSDSSAVISYLDVATQRDPTSKAAALRRTELVQSVQGSHLSSPKSIVAFGRQGTTVLGDTADSRQGLHTGESERFERNFWEVASIRDRWEPLQGGNQTRSPYGGRSTVILWESGTGRLAALADSLKHRNHAVQNWRKGSPFWGKNGVAVNLVRFLSPTIYTGDRYSAALTVLMPHEQSNLPAMWAFAASGDLERSIRTGNRGIGIAPGYPLTVPFDLEHWTKVAAEQYPDGLPEPHSDDPTQWLFKGTIPGSTAPLQVAVARLLGYRWPDQESDDLDELADDDGIVPLPSVRGETPAAERLRALLARVYGSAWSPALLDQLLADAGSPGATLQSWLRDDFFAQHVRLFSNRPFIWQVWDGRKDGFSVLLNYHRLDGPALEKLTYTYLNDWIERQRSVREEPTAEARLVAALGLQAKLKQILDGEPDFDIYVRWKSLAEQPIGWQPDLDDGVRLNIRPFVTAGILRAKFTINWNKDRGANPDGSERLNDLHHTRAEKLATREGAS